MPNANVEPLGRSESNSPQSLGLWFLEAGNVLHTYIQSKWSNLSPIRGIDNLGKRREEEKEGEGKAKEGREASAKRDATLLNTEPKEKQESNSP